MYRFNIVNHFHVTLNVRTMFCACWATGPMLVTSKTMYNKMADSLENVKSLPVLCHGVGGWN